MLVALLPLAGPALAADPYKLAISDKITVRVVDWKPAEQQFEEWTAIGGDYVVGPTGTTAFPFVGETQSAGQSTDALATALSQGLQRSLGLINAPDVTIAVAEFGPVYVTGDVEAPGEYKFSPGLNVIKALSLAGGARRTAEDAAGADRDLISATGALYVLNDEHLRLLALRARLDAELANADAVAIPSELADNPAAPGLIGVEQSILEAHARQLVSQTTAVDDRVALLNREIETFGQKRQAIERQLAQAEEQLTNVRNLAQDGLSIVSRVSALETNVADLQGRLLDIDTAVLQARQDIGDAEKERVQLGDVRISELTLERQKADADIAGLVLKLGTQQGLVQHAMLGSGLALGTGAAVATYRYTIIRQGEDIAADDTTALEAGDVIKAELQLAP
ncbi:polysaccharide biosynthesis/export family protein [uncultured Devosia sp.]|uniref:polysaccharide biosynthesis/export family protein n=1 Tax=uncultured Devosia sp. TaxID=211434 RepID=UPI0035CB329B